MKNFATKVKRFLVSEDGPTAVEYAVMLALIIIVCLATISALGTVTNTAFSRVAVSVSTVSS
jgi:pilus assembly protein Flp/PilA